MTIKRSGHNFIFEPDGNVTPDQFETTYGDVESHQDEKTLEVQLWASDGTERSPPVDFTLRLHYDPSGYFPQPAENRSISRWDLPDAIEISEGTSTLSGATVMWASPLAGVRNWATGNPTTPISCRHGLADPGQPGMARRRKRGQRPLHPGHLHHDRRQRLHNVLIQRSARLREPVGLGQGQHLQAAPPQHPQPAPGDGGPGRFPACSGSAIDITVIVINVNEPPKFPSETNDRSLTENTAAGQDIGTPVLSHRPGHRRHADLYALDGTDAAPASTSTRSHRASCRPKPT